MSDQDGNLVPTLILVGGLTAAALLGKAFAEKHRQERYGTE